MIMKKYTLYISLLIFSLAIFKSTFAISARESTITVVKVHGDIEMVAYPNPFKDVINLEIDANNTNPTLIKIFDIIGVQKQVIELDELNAKGKFTIQIKDLNEGIYFCNIYSNNKLLDSKKIICSK